ILVSGDGGWEHAVVDMASKLSGDGTFVAGVDIREYLDGVKKSREVCLDAGGDFRDLAMRMRTKYGLPADLKPILMGYSSRATLVYAAAAESADAFAGALSFGFCPDFEFSVPFCPGQTLETSAIPHGKGLYVLPDKRLQIPWIVFQGSTDQVCNSDIAKHFVSQVPSGE